MKEHYKVEVREVKMIDVTSPELVEVVISEDSKTLWINVDGICMFRACRIKELIFDGKGTKFVMEEVKGG